MSKRRLRAAPNTGTKRPVTGGKSGNEFVVLVPNEYIYHDREVAEDLGVVSVERRAGGAEPTYIDDLFTDLYYNEEKRNAEGYHAFVIPRLKRSKVARCRSKKGSEAGAR